MNLAAHIRGAWPTGAAKGIATATGRSIRTGKRIAASGVIPLRLRAALVRAVERQIARNCERLRQLEAELRALDYGEMLGKAAERRAQTQTPSKAPHRSASAVGPSVECPTRLAQRPADVAVKDRDA